MAQCQSIRYTRICFPANQTWFITRWYINLSRPSQKKNFWFGMSSLGRRNQKSVISVEIFSLGYFEYDFWIPHAKKLSCAKFQSLSMSSSQVIEENVNSKWRILGRSSYFAQNFKVQYLRNYKKLGAEIFKVFSFHKNHLVVLKWKNSET